MIIIFLDNNRDIIQILNQACAGHRLACAWFLEITFSVCVCVCVRARVYTPEAINNYTSGVIQVLYD